MVGMIQMNIEQCRNMKYRIVDLTRLLGVRILVIEI